MSVLDVASRKEELDGNYCLVLTSNSVEKEAVKAVTNALHKACVGQSTSGAYLGLIVGALVLHISGESGVSKVHSIGRIANAFLRNPAMPKPRLVLLVGFCWRNPANTPADGLVISNHVWCTNLRHAVDGWMAPKATWQQSPVELDELQEQRISSDLKAAGLEVQVGPIASAEALFMDSELRDQLVRAHPALIGGEMEAFAFVDSQTSWLVLKAASDAGGDDFSREKQEAAAATAAAGIGPLLASLERDASISREDMARSAALRNLIDGGVIEFSANQYGIEELNDVLDGELGPQLEYKLRRYLSPAGYGPAFLRDCVDALLELTQNAIRHGKANIVRIEFDATRLSYLDDGDIYDSLSLVGQGRGGARALSRLLSHQAKGAIQVTNLNDATGNGYLIDLLEAHAVLDAARRNCSARVREGVIGLPYGRHIILEIPPGCSTVYLDTTLVRMSSRKYVLVDEVARLVAAGRTVYVGCRDMDDVGFFQEELRDCLGPQVIVFLDASLPSDNW
ncbi:MAG: hypothetical protein H2060_10370 [Azoarcus sp.]|nr:hypothetical protein [Azoarcus sp.]